MKILLIAFAAIAILQGCMTTFNGVKVGKNTFYTQCSELGNGRFNIGTLKTSGCQTVLPDDIRAAVVKDKMSLNYDCKGGKCSISVKSKDPTDI